MSSPTARHNIVQLSKMHLDSLGYSKENATHYLHWKVIIHMLHISIPGSPIHHKWSNQFQKEWDAFSKKESSNAYQTTQTELTVVFSITTKTFAIAKMSRDFLFLFRTPACDTDFSYSFEINHILLSTLLF